MGKSADKSTTPRRTKSSSKSTFKCRQCDKTCASKEGLKKHLTAKHPLTQCRKCDAKFKSKDSLMDHLAAKHPTKRNKRSKKKAGSKPRSKPSSPRKKKSSLRRATKGKAVVKIAF